MDLGIITSFFCVLFVSIFNLTVALHGRNVCTQIQSVIHINRVPTAGIMTQKIRYTTKCAFGIGQCSKYRIIYVPAYREDTRLKYRVAQICCPGFVVKNGRCVPAPPPTTTKDPKVDPTPAGKSPGGSPVNTNPAAGAGGVLVPGPGTDRALGPGNPVFGTNHAGAGRNGVTGKNAVSGGTRNNNPNGPGNRHESGPWVGLGPRTPTGTDTGGGRAGGGRAGGDRGGGGGDQGGPGGGERGGTQRTSTIDRNRNYPRHTGPNQPVHRDKHGKSGSIVDGVYPDIDVNGANHGADIDPGYLPRNYDPVMAFVSSATAAIGVLTLASTVLGIFLLHRRHQANGGYGGKRFGSFRSLGSAKSIETKVEMQTLTSVESSAEDEKPKSIKDGKSRNTCPYEAIEQWRNEGAEFDAKDNAQLLAPSGNTSENNSKGTKKSRRNSTKMRSLPPEPPTYAVVRKPKKDEGSDGKETRMAVTSMCGESSSLSASLEGPFTERESAHIYAQINRKSKGVSSSWSRSSSLPSRPTTLVSNPDLQTSSSYRAIESFTRSLGRATHKLDVRRSGSESSGYSSLQESKETLLYDTCSRKEKTAGGAGVAPAALYRTLTEKGLCGKTEYDKLSRGVKEGTQENDESIQRGYATLNG
ncbi:uncharacterized protein [Amphiura filiformis]|uniref:uncharacterized protein n=1 Tax=Amphiura filiformis TaxID=82378 RepID=UPI003B218142